jgi:hypothetical protein
VRPRFHFVLEHADGLDVPAGPVAALQACEGRLSLGYLDTNGRLAETAFELGGAAAAMSSSETVSINMTGTCLSECQL